MNREITAAISLWCLAVGQNGWAQEVDSRPVSTETANPRDYGEDIVVTAQKREESIQDIAGSVSAFSSAQLEARGIRTVQDLQFQVPGLQAGTTGSGTIIFIRGVGQSVGQPGVATHVDGVYQARPALVALSQVDVERVEVLRGPQGTLYGRNATSGAVNFVTRAPTDHVEGYVQATVGNYADSRLTAVANLPLAEGVRTRLVFDARDLGRGFVKNVVPGNPDVGATRNIAGRLRTAIDLGANATLDVTLFAAHTSGGGDYLVLRNVPTPASVVANPYLAGMIVPLEPFRTSANRESRRDADAAGATATLSWDLGALRLRSVSGFYRFNFKNSFDADGTQLDITPGSNDFRSRTFSQEVTLSARMGPVDGVVGFYYLNDETRSRVRYDFPLGLNVPALRAALVPGASLTTQGVPYKTSAYALFTDVTIDLSDRLRLIGGARYSHERQRNTQTNQSGPLQTPFGIIPLFTSCLDREIISEFNSFTPRAGIQFDLDGRKSANLYATVSRGFKAGGLNQSLCGNTYNPERLMAYEAGMKARLLDGRMTINATAFHYDYGDFQINDIRGLSAFIINAPKAKVDGVEIETAFALGRAFQLNGNIAFLNSRYGELRSVDSLAPQLGPQDVKGNYLNYSPKVSGNVGLQYRVEAGRAGSFTLRSDLYFTSRFYLREFNNPLDSQKAYTRLNLALIWDAFDRLTSIKLYGANVGNTSYLSTMGVSDNFGARFVNWGAPRQYGAEVTRRF